jgi:hypothetical protein
MSFESSLCDALPPGVIERRDGRMPKPFGSGMRRTAISPFAFAFEESILCPKRRSIPSSMTASATIRERSPPNMGSACSRESFSASQGASMRSQP